MRIIFFAGKGGVGKTSVAAATGLRTSEAGNRTVILSLDIAHSLSDIFDLDKELVDQNKGRPIEIQKNLWIQELDIQEEIQNNWGEIHRYISTLLNTSGLDEILAEELAILPGMEEVSLLLYINKYLRQGSFDVILLDCAPTGESLRFISIPTTLEWYINKIFNMERAIAKYARPVAKRFSDVPLPGDDYFQAIERLFKRLQGVDEVLCDPDTTSVRLVTNPEKIVLKETQRALMYFCLHKINVDAIIMNRMLPQNIQDQYFETWKRTQERYLEDAHALFRPLPIFQAHLHKDEILGPSKLRLLGEQVYRQEDPLENFFQDVPYHLKKENGRYEILIRLPHISKRDVKLYKISDELIVRVGGFKRHILLPRQAIGAARLRAKAESPYLKIYLEEGDENHEQKEEQ